MQRPRGGNVLDVLEEQEESQWVWGVNKGKGIKG